MAPEHNHSTGRGGAGNIGPGEGIYTDGNIVREGLADDTTQPHSSGRGGAGNISHPAHHNQHQHNGHDGGDHQHHQHDGQHGKHAAGRHEGGGGGGGEVSTDYVPETAMRPADQAGYENFHTGRGGEGNIHRDRFGGHSGPQHHGGGGEGGGWKDKAKHAVGLDHHHGHGHGHGGQHEGEQHGGK